MQESFKLIGEKDLKAVSWYNLRPEVQLETMSLLRHIRIMFRPLCSEGEPLNREERGKCHLHMWADGWKAIQSILSLEGEML